MRTYYPTAVWLAFTLVGLAIGTFASVFTALAIDELSLGVVADGGQFAVYTFGMLFSTLFLLNRPGEGKLPFSEWFTLGSVVVLLCATAFVILTTLQANQTADQAININPEVFRWPSIGLFSAAALVGAIAFQLDEQRIRVAPREDLKKEEEELASEFRKGQATDA